MERHNIRLARADKAWNAPLYERLGFIRYQHHDIPTALDLALKIDAAQGLQHRVAMYLQCIDRQ